MRLRTDYKYALIDQFQTYWNAFDNTEEFYSDIMAVDPELLKYTISKTKKVRGTQGFVSKVIYSQNELWMIYYSDRKDALEAVDNIDKSKIVEPLEKKRYNVSSRIVTTKRVPHL